ncbi:MAG: PEGA domain-containing protein [Polyangiaceae bacterium]|nr:PEGA domain-containing protein [Myxococcales bacterium]MCB9588405.1 PEGA domain-containing protein [Polyangiaceae bacterium]
MRHLKTALLTIVMLSSSSVLAGPEEAKAHFERGAEAYKEARYEEAIDGFSKAYAEDPKPILLYNIAQAYERLGDTSNALRAYRDFLREGPSDDDRAVIETRIRNLEKRLQARGLQQLSVFAQPVGAAVFVDGTAVGNSPWTGELPPGRHRIRVEQKGYASYERELLLGPDRAQDMDVTLQAENEATPAPPSPQTADAGAAPTISVWTWTALGVTTAALATSLVFELSRQGAESDAENADTQLAYQDAYSSMESRQTTSRVFLGLGAVAAVTSGVLLYLDLSKKSDTKVGFACLPGQCAAFAGGHF